MATISFYAWQALNGAWEVFAEMAPYLLFGFALAGVLHVALPTRFIEQHLGGRGVWPVLKASLFGVPLPLCSCSVIPVTAALRKHGASRGAATAFLLSSPTTGLDSIFVTLSLLGPLVALYRPVVAFLMGVAGGWAVDALVKRDAPGNGQPAAADTISESCGCGDSCSTSAAQTKPAHPVVRMLRYAFITLPQDIGKPLLFGMAIAVAINMLVPHDFLSGYLGHGLVPMFVLMAVGIPMFVCATASVPIAAALIMAGVSPGAALVFLITGPISNASEMGALWKVFGYKAVAIYIATVALGSLAAGLGLDWIIQVTGWRVTPAAVAPAMEQVNLSAALVMLSVFVYALWPRRKVQPSAPTALNIEPTEDSAMQTTALAVTGMTCNGCANSVQRALAAQPGVEAVTVDLASGTAQVSGTALELGALIATVERLGFTVQPAN